MTTLRTVLENSLASLRLDRTILCGLTGNVDIVIPVRDGAFRAAQERFGSSPEASDQPPAPTIASPGQALDYAAWFMARGVGGEASIPSMRPVRELIESLPNYRSIGGTGAQAANWLAHAGFTGIVLYLPLYDEAFREVLLVDKMDIVDNRTGYADLLAEDAAFSEIHCILDYQQGARLRYGGADLTAPRHDRVILDGGRANADLRLAEDFIARAERAYPESSLLVNGYNLCRDLEIFHRFAGETRELIRRYRAANPRNSFVHIEDSYQWDHVQERRDTISQTIWPLADSLGMNEVEFGAECALFGLDATRLTESLLEIARRHGLKRVCLHTAANCRTVTRFPIERELLAIGLAILFSSAKAYYGAFVGLDKIRRLIAETAEISENALVSEAVPLVDGYRELLVPTLAGLPVRASIGLGDAFTAGLMAYL